MKILVETIEEEGTGDDRTISFNSSIDGNFEDLVVGLEQTLVQLVSDSKTDDNVSLTNQEKVSIINDICFNAVSKLLEEA